MPSADRQPRPGAVLFVTAAVVWRAFFRDPLNRSSLVGLLAYHVVYGLGLGVWIRMTRLIGGDGQR